MSQRAVALLPWSAGGCRCSSEASTADISGASSSDKRADLASCHMSEEAMDAGAVEVKVESDDEVEPYDGTYARGVCSESVRGTAALKCSQCSANPVHWACVAGTKYAGQCATCVRETMEAWRGASTGTAAPSEIIDLRDLEAEGAGAAVVAALTGAGAREDAVPAVGGAVVVAADEVGRGVQGGRADAGGGRSGKGKELAGEEAAEEDGSDGRAKSAYHSHMQQPCAAVEQQLKQSYTPSYTTATCSSACSSRMQQCLRSSAFAAVPSQQCLRSSLHPPWGCGVQ